MPKYPKRIRMTHLDRALRELEVKERYGSAYHARLVGNRLEIHMLGGDVLTWPPSRPTVGPRRGDARVLAPPDDDQEE
jgi:hypothetical protein